MNGPRGRIPAGVHEGGQFAASARSEADVALDGTAFQLRLDEPVRLDTAHLDALPDWPLGGEPSLDYSWDENDHFGITLTWEGEAYGVWYTGPGWKDVDDSFDIGEGPEVSSGDRDRLRAYGRAALTRASILTGEVTTAAHSGRARAAVQALALGRARDASRLAGAEQRA